MSFYLKMDAQSFASVNFKEIDSATYSDFLKKNWTEVIEVGDIALKSNIDYYYLRMRLGIANFNNSNYLSAEIHFRKALKFNKGDKDAQVYLYDTYKILGKNTRAYKLSGDFLGDASNLVYSKRKVVEKVFGGAGYSLSNNYKLNDHAVLDNNEDTVSGFQVLIGNKSLISAGAAINVNSFLSYYIGFNHLQIQKKSIFQYNEFPIVFDSVRNEPWGYQNFYSVKNRNYRSSFDEVISQNELYQNIRVQFAKGWATTLFANLLLISTVNNTASTQQKTIEEIDYQVINDPPVYFTYDYDEMVFNRSDSSLINYVYGINIEKDFSSFSVNLVGSLSSINAGNQSQLGISTSYYFDPKAKWFGVTGVSWFNEKWKSGEYENRFIFSQKIGGKLLPNMWVIGDIIYGNLNNAAINNGSIVYNQVDDMKFRSGLTIKMMLGQHFELNLNYHYISYISNFIQLGNDENGEEFVTREFDYQTQNIFGGVVWKF